MFVSRRMASGLVSAFVVAAVLAGPVDAYYCGHGYPPLPPQSMGSNPELGSYESFGSDPSPLPGATLYSAGGAVELGLTAEGNVGIWTGNNMLGLALFRDGEYQEALASFCRCEGWGIGDLLSGVSGWASWDDGGVSHNLHVTDSYSSPTIGLLSNIDIDNGSGTAVFGVNQYAYGLVDKNLHGGLFEIDITVKNLTNADQDVIYRRVMDWDVPPYGGGEYVSAHDRPVGGSGSATPAVTITNDGFASANPLVPATALGIGGPFDDNGNLGGPVDDGALFDFRLGRLGPSASMSFSVFYGAAFDKGSALHDLQQVGVTAYSVATSSTDKAGNHSTFSFGFGDFVNHSSAQTRVSTGKAPGGHVDVTYVPSELVKTTTNPAFEGAAAAAAILIRDRADKALAHYHSELGWNPPDTVTINVVDASEMRYDSAFIHKHEPGATGYTPRPDEILLNVSIDAGYEKYFSNWASSWAPGSADMSATANEWSTVIDHECWHIVQNDKWGWPMIAFDYINGEGTLVESSAVAAQDTFGDWDHLSYSGALPQSYQDRTNGLLVDYQESALQGGSIDQPGSYKEGAILQYFAERLGATDNKRALLQMLEGIASAGGPFGAGDAAARIRASINGNDLMRWLDDFFVTALISPHGSGIYQSKDGLPSISLKPADVFPRGLPGVQDQTIAYGQSEVFLYKTPPGMVASWASAKVWTYNNRVDAWVELIPVKWSGGDTIDAVGGNVLPFWIGANAAPQTKSVTFSDPNDATNALAVVVTAGCSYCGSHDPGNYKIDVTFGNGPAPSIAALAGSSMTPAVQNSQAGPALNLAVSPQGDAGMPLEVTATPTDDGGAIANASVVAQVTDPAGKVRRFAIPDVGFGNDPMAGDGTYAKDVWGTSLAGTYQIDVTATGVGNDGSAFTATASETVTLQPGVDSDGDGITDEAEALLGLDPHNPADAQVDLDRDGLSLAQELAAGTDPQNADTDGGGESDGSEIARGLDPLSPGDDAPVGSVSVAAVANDGRAVGVMVNTSAASGTVDIARTGSDGTVHIMQLPVGQQSFQDGPLPAGTYAYRALVTLPSGAMAPVAVSNSVVVAEDVTAPLFDFTLEGNRNETTGTSVHIWVTETSEEVSQMRVAETAAGLETALWVPFAMHSTYELTSDLGDHTAYVQLRDAAGNVSAPLSRTITLVATIAPPSSFADSLGTYVSDPAVSVSFHSLFPGGAGSVELWERHTPEGGLPGDWSPVASATQSPFSATLGSGPGKYEFYTIAVDANGVHEEAPGIADTLVVLLGTQPASSINPIPPVTGGNTVHLTITSADVWGTINRFDVWERHSLSPGTYSAWVQAGMSTSPSLYVSLTAGPGDYEFYSIASDNLGGQEARPAAADAHTTLDRSSLPSSTVNALPPLMSNPALPIVISADDEGARVGGVILYSRCLPHDATTWSPWSYDQSDYGDGSPLLSHFSCGDGAYEFYSVAYDWAGNLEAVPTVADATTVLDSVQPVSSVGSLPATVSSSPLSVPFSASDTGTGVASVELWQQFKPAGGSAGAWVQVATGTVSPFSTPLASGAGTYYFYTIAVDFAGNREAIPTKLGFGGPEPAPDASVVLDTSVLSSAVGLLPAGVSTTTLSVPFTAASSASGPGLASVELWERFEAAGTTDWTSWTQVQSGLTSPFSVSLDRGQGRYEFRTIAVDAAGNHEAAPEIADAFTVLAMGAPVTSIDPLPPTTTAGSITLPYSVGPGSPAASVEIWRRFKPVGSTTWGPWGWATAVTSSPANVSLPWGKGSYEFYSIGISAAGLREPVPANAGASIVREPTDPGSSVGTLLEAASQTSIAVPYTAEFPSGEGSVELWESYAPVGSSTFSSPTLMATVTAPASMTAPLTSGDGTYAFYTVAIDGQSGIREGVPASADAATVLDTAAPTSSLAGPGVANWTSPWVEVMSTDDGSGIAKVNLYYRRAGEQTWNLADTAPGSGSATCYSQLANCDFYPILADGDGVYEFTAVVTDKAGNIEAGPGEAKVSVTLDTIAPTVTVTPLAPGVRWGSVSITYSASDAGSGVAYVDVYRRFLPIGSSTWGDWNYTYTRATTSPLTTYVSSGDGRYEFYLKPCDNAGNCRAMPDSATAGDTFTVLDSVAPVSAAGSLTSPTTASSVDIPYTASDPGGSGVAKVDLYRRFTVPGGTPSGYYSKIATVTSAAESGTFTAVALANDGTYEFYTRVTDAAANVEAAPSPLVADATIVRSTAPASNVSSSISPFQKASPLQVPWVVTSSGSGIASVELWQRYTVPGATPSGSYSKVATNSGSATSGTFSVTASSDGTYELYTIAVPTSGSREAAPAAADALVVLDKVVPSSTASATSPTKGSSVDVAYTAADNTNGSGLASVELWQRYTAPGGTPSGSYTKIATITSPAASGTFTAIALANDGRYEFYTIAVDRAGNRRAIPSAADASVLRDTAAPSSSATAPATTSAMSVSVTYTINDGGGTGPASIELWQRYTVLGGTPSGGYSKMATITGTATSGTFSNVATAADGRYEFYTIALDALGNSETQPTSADATTVRDTRIPATNAGPIAAAVSSTSLPVPYTVTIGNVSSVGLYQRWTTPGGTPSGSYTLLTTITSSATSGTFTVTLSKGAGRYEFYTLGVSQGGVTEAAPASADAFTVLDTTAPTSAAGTLTTPRSSTAVSLTYTASDNTNGSGVASVELWQRFEAAGSSTWSSWALATTATSSPISVTLSAGDGRYEFYTRAIDAAGNHEAAPSAADAFTILDTTGPVTSASALAGGVKTTSLSVAYTASDAGSSVSSVELYQRYTAPGVTPSGSYTKIATATTSPFSVTLSSGAGRYEFYTIGVDALGNREAAPSSADAFTVLDTTAPTSAAGPVPASVTSTALSVPYTAADDTYGSGLSKVELYQRWTAPGGTPSGAYTKLSATPTAGSFSITLGSGSGTYQFYTIATDAATNAEAAPSVPDASTVYTAPDTTAPTSSFTAPPSTSSAASIAVAYTASDNSGGSGLASVECWFRYKASDGVTAGAWTTCGTSTTASGSFTLAFGSGAGIYDVLTVAVDVAGNREGAIANPPVAGATPKSSVRSVAWVASGKVNTDTGTALQDNAAYVVGSDGTVYAVWEDSRNGNTDIYFSSRNPSTGAWAAETKLNTDTGTTGQRTPSIAIDGSGNLYVVWADDRNGATNTDIFFAKRTGTTWSANIKVNSDTATAVQSNPRISVSSAGIAVAVWYDKRSSQTNIYSARLPAGSTTWSTNYNITTSNTSAAKAAPDVAVASDGTAWSTWQDNRTGGGDIYVASLGPTATTWSTNTKVSDDSGASSLDKSPRIGLTSANLPVVAYLDGRTTNAQVRVSNRTSGGTWNASVQVSDSSAKPATGLALAVKADGGVIVAWDDTRSTSAIWGAQCEAGSGTSSVTRCGPAEKWSDLTGASSHPTVVASPAQVYLGWRDDTAGGGDIRIRLRNPS